MVRVSALGVEGVGLIPGSIIPKRFKMLPVATLLGAQHNKASTGPCPCHMVTNDHSDLIKANCP